MTSRGDAAPPRRAPAEGTHVVTSLRQMRALVDPLRVRILREFVETPRTTKQVAERLGEKPTRLYRHVEALAAAGLLELKEERRKRGTMERYFQAIASRFEVDRSLLSVPGAGEGEGRRTIQALLQRVESEALDAIEQCDEGDPLGPFVLRADLRAGPTEVRRLRQKLLEWVEECQAATRSDSAGRTRSGRRFGALVAFFPLRAEPRQR